MRGTWIIRSVRYSILGALTLSLVGMSPIAVSPAPKASPAGSGPRGAGADRSYYATIEPSESQTVTYKGAELRLEAGAVAEEITIGITTLDATELPKLAPGMTGVTKGPYAGYRFSPDGARFSKPITVTLPYDKSLLLAGQTEQDIFTYYYDTSSSSWQALERVAVDTDRGVVVSFTSHFTDMINSTVTVPDHPTPMSFNPTAMKDIKAADPGAGINLIEPPQPNNMGTANLRYPIDVPPGRVGMQPSLAVQYGSSGGNGWMGIGWDLPMQAITIDTRWGVPRYDAGLETETYVLNGEQLTPVVHRGVLQARAPEKEFHARVEGMFRKIIRHGNDPTTYWWEIIDKQGTKNYFGGDPSTGGPVADSTLTDSVAGSAQNIYKWALREVRDANGNTIKYRCDRVIHTGVSGGAVDGVQLYLSNIRYTGFAGVEGPYTVEFVRERGRAEVMIDCRSGFKMVTADLLNAIHVKLNGDRIRSYQFEYETGAFEKTRLKSITQLGSGSEFFNKHEFEYFDEVRSGGVYSGFDSPQNWNTGPDGVDWRTGTPLDALLGPLTTYLNFGAASALSGAVSDSDGGHIYVGFNPDAPTKQGSAGGKVGFNFSSNDTILLMQDINGDQLPDKVFKTSDGEIYFRANQSGPNGTTSFGPRIHIASLPALSKEDSTTISFGVEAYIAVVNGLFNHGETFTTGTVYFSDVNGDGLLDLINGGTVLFNHLENGIPTFTPDSHDTPVAIGNRAVDANGIIEDFESIYQQAIDTAPLQDTLRRWVAPFAGTVSISGDLHLIQDLSPARAHYQTADGVRVAIQHDGNQLYSETIAADDYNPKTPTGVGSIGVSAGDRIYFRVGSVFDGKFDQVSWNPQITYQGVSPLLDVNGLNVFNYPASDDFTLAGRRGITVQVPFTGTLRLTGSLNKLGTTTDDVTLQVYLNNAAIFSQAKSWNQTGAIDPTQDIAVARDDVIALRVKVDSPIDVRQIEWTPNLFYTSVTGDPNVVVQDSNGNYLIQLKPPYDIDLYPERNPAAPPVAWVAPMDGTLTARTQLQVSDPAVTGVVAFTIKKRGELLAKRFLAVGGGIVSIAIVSVSVQQDDELVFDYSSFDPELSPTLTNRVVIASFGDPDVDPIFAVPSAFNSATHTGVFAQPYRGWAFAGYNGNRDRADMAIVESDLSIDFAQLSMNSSCCSDPMPSDDCCYDPRRAKAYLFFPDFGAQQWRGPDDLGYATGDSISSSRLGVDFISVPRPDTIAGAEAVARLSRTTQDAVGGGVSIGPISGTGSLSDGTSYSQTDSLDMNGDQFPEIVANARIQYTTLLGGLEDQNRLISRLGRVRESDNGSTNIGVGGNASFSRSGSTAKTASSPGRSPREEKTGSQMVSLGLSATLGAGDSSGQYDLMDINGDGLPDRITRNGATVDGATVNCGSSLCVAFNLGYGFAPFEPWGDAPVEVGASRDLAVAGSLGFNGGIYDFAGGLSLDKTTSHAGCASVDLGGACDDSGTSLVDINGDGLPDRVRANGGTLHVAFNTGNGFASVSAWNGALADGIAKNGNTGLGGGGYFTIGIGPLCLFGCYVIINPGADFARNLARSEAVIRDVDGDGYPDHISSQADDAMTVALNKTGRTNLLKRVKRPLGATITLGYERDGNTYDLPQSRWNLARAEVYDGFCGDGVDTLVSTYRYESGMYNRNERDFYGYRTVVEEQRDHGNADNLYRSTTRTYLNDNYYNKGLLECELVQDATGTFTGCDAALPDAPGRFTKEVNTYRLIDIATGTDVANPNSTTATVFPQLVRTDRLFYEGLPAPGKSTYTTSAYDALGNVIQFFDAGDAGTQDDVTTDIQYFSDPAAFIVGIPNRIVVTSNGLELRRREADIEPGSGDLRQVRQYLVNGQVAVTDLDYLPNGNLLRVTGPANLHGQRYAVDFEYDAPTATHMTRIHDSFGYVSTATYDLRFGAQDITTDINGNQTDYDYDAFGRVSAITGPYEIGVGVPTLRFEYHPDASSASCSGPLPSSRKRGPSATRVTNWALTHHIDSFRDINDPIDTVLFTDGLKRVLQTKKDGTIHAGPDSAPQNVMIVSGRIKFDFVGRTMEQRYPTTEPLGTPGIFNLALDPISPTKTEYDVLDRITRITIPDNTSTLSEYGFGPDRSGAQQFETKVTDANNIEKRTYRDIRDLVTSIREVNNGGAQVIWTSYQYDPMKQLVRVEDDRHNLTQITYDNFGRATSINNPDAGRTESRYDLAGDLIGKITANLRAVSRQIAYDYEFNRLTRITYPLLPGNNVTYTYGAPGAPFNRAGRIVLVTDESGSGQRFYGRLGEIVKEIKTVASDTQGSGPNSPEVYTTQYTYDTWGRLQQLVYPDGEVCTYRYDSGGNVRAAAGLKTGVSFPYLARLEYDKFEQRVFIQVQNGVRTTYAYDPLDRRLAHLAAGRAGAPRFQNLSYTYDDVGNILQTNNDVPVPNPPVYGGPVLQNYGYDDLYRLTSASGTHQYAPNKTSRYSYSQSYDTIHNITQKNQLHETVEPGGSVIPQHDTTYNFSYVQGSSRPHAPTHIGERTYTYDANGNQTGWRADRSGQRRTIEWDEENRIQSITDNGHTKTYKYDDSGERVIKRGPQGETAYVNPYFTMRNRTVATKHVYAGTTRLASKLTPGSSTPQPPGGVPEINFLYFYHPDHLGSSSYVTDDLGRLYEHLQYFPFGETWVQEKSNTQRTPYLYTAKEFDEETDLYYHGARYYDPKTSVWQSTDPILSRVLSSNRPHKLSLYGYSANNPIRYNDPTGLDETPTFLNSQAEIIRLGQSSSAQDRTRALNMIIDILGRPATLDQAVYNPNYVGVPDTGVPRDPQTGELIQGRARNGVGDVREGARQAITVGPQFFENISANNFSQRVRTVRHELEHVVQRSQRNPITSSPVREFLGAYVQLAEDIPGIQQLSRQNTRTRITDPNGGTNHYWSQMSAEDRRAYQAQYDHLQRLLEWSNATDRSPRPTR